MTWRGMAGRRQGAAMVAWHHTHVACCSVACMAGRGTAWHGMAAAGIWYQPSLLPAQQPPPHTHPHRALQGLRRTEHGPPWRCWSAGSSSTRCTLRRSHTCCRGCDSRAATRPGERCWLPRCTPSGRHQPAPPRSLRSVDGCPQRPAAAPAQRPRRPVPAMRAVQRRPQRSQAALARCCGATAQMCRWLCCTTPAWWRSPWPAA